MAVTENLHTGNGSRTNYSFTFPYLKTTDIKASIDGTVTTAFTAGTPTATEIQFNTAPANSAVIRIFRDTATDKLAATFFAGSAIKSQDLNESFTQNLYATQEAKNDADAAWQDGDETISSTESWQSANDKVATTAAIDGRVDVKIDTALSNDVLAGTDLSKTASGGQVTINHNVTGASSVNNNNGTVIQDLTLNANGHVTGHASYDLDNRFYTETELDGGQLDNRYFTETELTTGGAIDSRYYTKTQLDAGQLDNKYYTETELDAGQLDNRYYTESEADARFYNLSSGEEIQSGETWVAADNKIATTAAIDARVIDLVDDVGGFVPIANETSFPAANPDVNNGAGTLVSIKAMSATKTPSGGNVTVANGAGSGNTVTITGCGSTQLAAGFGVIVETTSTLHTYTFHRLTPKATEVTTVAGNISNINAVANNETNINSAVANQSNINSAVSNASNINTAAGNITNINTVGSNSTNINTVAAANANINTVAGSISNVNTTAGSIANINTVASNINSVNDFSDVYRVDSSAPTSHIHEGDHYFYTTANELKVYNGSTWQGGVTATGNLASLGANTFTGAQTFVSSQTFDGRDVSADGSKLDGIEAFATADQTASEIRTLVESASDSNVFTDADHTKLNGIETGATADQTASDIKTLLQSNKLTVSEIADGQITSAKIVDDAITAAKIDDNQIYSSHIVNGTIVDGDISSSTAISGSKLQTASSGNAGSMSAAEHIKLNGIATGAEVNVQSDWNSSSGDSQILNKPSIPVLIDEDDMATNSASQVPSQQSVKAYVTNQLASAGVSYATLLTYF